MSDFFACAVQKQAHNSFEIVFYRCQGREVSVIAVLQALWMIGTRVCFSGDYRMSFSSGLV